MTTFWRVAVLFSWCSLTTSQAAESVTAAGVSPLRGPPRPTLYLTSLPQVMTETRVGQVFFTAGVAHGVTGTLRQGMDPKVLSFADAVPAGAPVYGLPMSRVTADGRVTPELVWCAPMRSSGGRLSAQCYSPTHRSVVWSQFAFSVRYLNGAPRPIEPIVVDPGPVSFDHPLVLNVRVSKVTRERIRIDYSVSYAGEPQWNPWRLQRDADGGARLRIGGAVLEIVPGQGKSLVIRTIGKFEDGADATPEAATPGVELQPAN